MSMYYLPAIPPRISHAVELNRDYWNGGSDNALQYGLEEVLLKQGQMPTKSSAICVAHGQLPSILLLRQRYKLTKNVASIRLTKIIVRTKTDGYSFVGFAVHLFIPLLSGE